MKAKNLQLAKYKGAEWFATHYPTRGARNIIKKRFVNSDRQSLEDTGLVDKAFTLSGVIAPRYDVNGKEVLSYFAVRQALINALEDGSGPGILIHPSFGKLTDIVAMNWNLDESETSLGESPITINFERDTSTGLPEAAQSVLASIVATNEALAAAAAAALAVMNASKQFAGNFQSMLDDVNDLKDKFDSAVEKASIVSDKLNAFANDIAEFGDNVVDLVATPATLATSITNLFLSVNGLFTTISGTLLAFESMYDFGDLKISVVPTTAGLRERKTNTDIINSNIQALALSYGYLNSAQLEFRDTTQIAEVASRLEVQFGKISDSGLLGSDVLNLLRDQRNATQDFFNAQKDIRPRVITINTPPTSARLLAFRHYGSSDLGETLAELNLLRRTDIIEGDVEILTS